jgi:hypothetical protein
MVRRRTARGLKLSEGIVLVNVSVNNGEGLSRTSPCSLPEATLGADGSETEAPAVARATLRRSQADVGKEFEPDGSQPRELARTRSRDYSVFNLTAYLHVASMGDRVGVDLWNYHTSDGRSLRKGVDYLAPFATGAERWPHKQISPFRASELHLVLRLAAVGWKDPRYREIARQIGGATPILDLTMP